MCSPCLSTQKPTWENCQCSLLSTFVGRIQTGCEQTERFFTHLYTSKTPCRRGFCKNRDDLINSGKRQMPTETLFCQHKLCCHWRSISNPTFVSVGTPLHWLGAVGVDSAGGSQPVRSAQRWAPTPHLRRKWWPFQLHLYQQRIYGNWRWAPECAAGWCCSLDEKVVCHIVCGQHRSDDTLGVSGVFSEVLTASSERAPTAALHATRLSGTEARRIPLDQSSLTRNAGEPGQEDTMQERIVLPQCQNFRSENVTVESRGSKRLSATCTASCLAQIC